MGHIIARLYAYKNSQVHRKLDAGSRAELLEKCCLGRSKCSIPELGLAIDKSWTIHLGLTKFMDTHVCQWANVVGVVHGSSLLIPSIFFIWLRMRTRDDVV